MMDITKKLGDWLENSTTLRRLDRMGFWWALGLGVSMGLMVVLGSVLLPTIVGLFLVVGAAVVGGTLTWTGKPVGVWEEVDGEGLRMIAIPGGSFLMGSPNDEPARFSDEQVHEVTLSPFYISQTAVTRKQYAEVMGSAPSSGNDLQPVTEVSWLDAIEFCNRLSKLEELPKCYSILGQNVIWMRDIGGYRLPTEAEWEYSARSGSQTAWSFGDDPRRLREYAWYDENASTVKPVATRQPNIWQLYDMHGNVWEWCWDIYANYPSRAVQNPRGLRGVKLLIELLKRPGAGLSLTFRVFRGGSFWHGPGNLRSACRLGAVPSFQDVRVGFRCVHRPNIQP